MSVNGTNNNFKVSTVGNGIPQEDWATTDPKAQELDDLFDIDGEGTSSTTGNSNAIEEYTCGDIQNGSYTTGADAEGTMWLEGFPPSLEEIMANNENAINYLDMVWQRYEKAKEDLRGLKKTYEQAIMSGTCTTDELQNINERLAAIDPALARCNAEMDKITELAGERAKTFLLEQSAMEDLNNDHWIGRPHVKGSFYVQINDDGTKTYIDPISKRPVPCPIMDPEYQAEIVNDSMKMIDAADSIAAGQDDLELTDVYLKLNQSALSNDNAFGCPIDIGIPEYFWVKRNTEDLRDSLYEIIYNEDHNEEKMAIFNEWKNGSQKVPEDLSDYAQVKVTGVKIISVPCGKTADGDELCRHVVEFYNDQMLITRMSIEGTEISGEHAAAATLENGTSYIAASSVGVAFHGVNRASPIEFDGSGFTSTGRHIVSDITQQLGGISNPGDDGQGDNAFEENVNAFRDPDFNTKEYSGGTWNDISHGLDTYDGASDRYMAPAEDSNGEGPYQTFMSGLFIRDVRGDITGSNYNDVIHTLGVNEYSQYALDHLPEDLKKITKDDPFYSNFVNAGGGNDIVVAGRGDNYIEKATMVWINDSGSMDENFIAMPDNPPGTIASDNVKLSPNQKNFVHTDGGHSMIYNPVEYNAGNDGDAETPDQVEANDGSYKDDWYEVTGGGSAEFGNSTDADLDYCQEQGAIAPPEGKFDLTFFQNAKGDPYDEWYDELTSVPDPDEMETDVDWEEVIGAKTELDDEMNSFFDSMFGDLNSFVGEYQDEEQTGF